MTESGDLHLLRALDRVREAPRCPRAVLNRAQALFAQRRASLGAQVLRMVYDSWKSATTGAPVPAFRGGATPRVVRFEGGGLALDLRVTPEADGRRRVQVAAEGVGAGAEALLHSPRASRARRLRLGDDGAAQALLPSSVVALEIEVREAGETALRTPRVFLREGEA